MNVLGMVQFIQAQIGASKDLPWGGPAAGTLFTGSTLIATGQYAELVNWILIAYKQIQLEGHRSSWRMRQGTLPMTIGQNVYTLTQIQALITDYETISPFFFADDNRYVLVWDPAVGISSQGFCHYIGYQDYRGWKDRQVIPTGKPSWFTRRMDATEALEFASLPDKAYNVTIDYRTTIDTLPAASGSVENAVPLYMPPRLHEAICWRAIAYWAQQRQNGAKFAAAMSEHDRIMGQDARENTPDMDLYTQEYFR